MCNLKSNKTLKEILEYKKDLKNLKVNQVELVLFPSTLYLSFFYDAPYKLGSQEISKYEIGSITGEVLASQLKSLKVRYVLLNHSEAKETPEDVVLKIKNATKEHIKVVLCIGEEKHQTMEETITEMHLKLKNILEQLSVAEQQNILFAYEPSWAINSGTTCQPDILNALIKRMKEDLKKEYKLDATILYGGGITTKNIKELAKLDNIDGFLLGNCANNPENVYKICEIL